MMAAPAFNPVRVEVDTGTLCRATRMEGMVTKFVPELVGRRVWWVDLVEADGSRLCVWDGSEESEAWSTADAIRKDWQIDAPVHCGRAP